jgi:hypothetical protein
MSTSGLLVLIMALAVAAPPLAFAAGRRLAELASHDQQLAALVLGHRPVPRGGPHQHRAGHGAAGLDFDLDALLPGGRPLLLVPVFLCLFLLLRGLPVALLAPRGLAGSERRALGLYSATALPARARICGPRTGPSPGNGRPLRRPDRAARAVPS